MNNKQLKKIFNKFNERFFAGRIPNLVVKFSDIKLDGLYRYTGQILINRGLTKHPALVMIILLHEMAHANLKELGYIGHEEDGGHHTIFFAELDRLYKVGAYEGLL